jgi:hypothetical protein
MPYPFYTPNDINWKKFAENENGKTFNFLKKVKNILEIKQKKL